MTYNMPLCYLSMKTACDAFVVGVEIDGSYSIACYRSTRRFRSTRPDSQRRMARPALYDGLAARRIVLNDSTAWNTIRSPTHESLLRSKTWNLDELIGEPGCMSVKHLDVSFGIAHGLLHFGSRLC